MFSCHIYINIGMPLRPVLLNVENRSTSIPLEWEHNNTCFERENFHFNLSLNLINEKKYFITSKPKFIIKDVIPSTTYTIRITAISASHQNSDPLDISVTTLGMIDKTCCFLKLSSMYCTYIYTYIAKDICIKHVTICMHMLHLFLKLIVV